MTSNVIPRSEAEHGKAPTADETDGHSRAQTHHRTPLKPRGRRDPPAVPSLRTLLQSCLNPHPPTTSIGFLAPLSDADADADADSYWRSLGTTSLASAACSSLFVILLPCRDGVRGAREEKDEDEEEEEAVAAVQLFTIPKATHAHRGEVAKLLMQPSCRHSGLGRAMMADAERFARDVLGLRVLTLDTDTGSPARAFYHSTGWAEWGTCPD